MKFNAVQWLVVVLLVAAATAERRRLNTKRVRIRTRVRPTEAEDRSDTDIISSSASTRESTINSLFERRRRPSIISSSSSSRGDVSTHKNSGDYKIVCYYTNWSQYRPKIGKYLPENIDPHLCTHIIYAFGWLKKGKLTSHEENDDKDPLKEGGAGLYDRVQAHKIQNPELKVLLAIGGWTFGTKRFKDMAETRYSRQTFIFSAIEFLRDRNFDGLDLDWEYPKGREDKQNYVLLVKELREAFEAEAQEVKLPRLLLSAAVPVGPDNVRGGYDVPAVASYMDFINLMAYDFHGKWERQAGHNAPLYAPSSDSKWRQQLSVTMAAEMWTRMGTPKEKLIIGMPTYGRSFTLSDPNNWIVNAPSSGGGVAGTYTREAGFLAYYEVCEQLRDGGAYIWDEEMQVPYMVKGDQWVGFDDERSIRNKMKWLKSEGYGGAMVWSLDMDDFTGTVCGGGKYPLIGAMREELLGIPREGNFPDINWQKVAKTQVAVATTLPPPTKISVADLLQSIVSKRKDEGETELVQGIPIGSNPRVMCYFTNWSHKRPGLGRFEPELLDPTLCTHVIYAFGTLEDNLLAASEDTDLGDGIRSGMYERVMKLKEKNPELRVLLAIGGWAFGSKPFKEVTENVFRMNAFVYDSISFLRNHNFDGLDIDWEYPRGQHDKESYTALVKELNAAFVGEAKASKKPRLLLSAAVPASFEAIAAGYDVPEISKYLDYINVMTYDFHGQWERQVGHNAPLFPLESASSYQQKLTVDYSAREWVKQGAPKEKIMVGIPTYGRSFELVEPEKFDIGAPASGGGTEGEYTKEAGFLSYYEVCDFLHQDNVTLVWDNEQQVPFAYRGNQWVGFDDIRSIKTKMEWLRTLGFGGVMIWSVDMDDFRGSCGMGKFPLINAVKEGLDGYRVDYNLEQEIGAVEKRDPNEIVCEEENGVISYHRDVKDCTMYYMCEGERKHHMPCPQALVFNVNENVCDWPENVVECIHLAPPKPA